jgi:hypothetical protein
LCCRCKCQPLGITIFFGLTLCVPTFSFTLAGKHPRVIAEGIYVWDGNYALAATERLGDRGYRLVCEAGDAKKFYGVHTNPKKSEKVTFTPEDKVIVLAEG